MKTCDRHILESLANFNRGPDYIREVMAADYQMTVGQWLHLLRKYKIPQSQAIEWMDTRASGSMVAPIVRKPRPEPVPRDIAAIRPICEACKFFVAAGESGACMHPRCGCAASRKRVDPWKNVKACPIGAW